MTRRDLERAGIPYEAFMNALVRSLRHPLGPAERKRIKKRGKRRLMKDIKEAGQKEDLRNATT